jgi:hypothetical protein
MFIKNKMELEGFSTSLAGRALYIYANPDEAWIPWEFINGTQYSCKILIRGDTTTVVEAENNWTAVFRPSGPRDWSMLATVIRGATGSVLLTFDSGCPRAPEAFISFLDSTLATGRTIVTRIWIGVGIEVPCIPDAIFFPSVSTAKTTAVYEILGRLPARNTHGPWKRAALADWLSLCAATASAHLGLVITDIEESEWSLFWHKIADSVAPSGLKQGLALARAGLTIVEKYNTTA